jgi:hypothetical protein
MVRDQQQGEMLERARMWAEMRHRERKSAAQEEKEELREQNRPAERRGVGKFLLAVAAVVAVVLLLGGGVYLLANVQFDTRLTSQQAWEEFAKDTKAAQQKYKGRFVRLSGKLKITTVGKGTALTFEPPEGAKWSITFSLPHDQVKDLQTGQEITVRCRFGSRPEPDGNLQLSNCTLVGKS